MRRAVALGKSPGQAIAEYAESWAGAAARVRLLRDVEAAHFGMPRELLRLLQSSNVSDVVINGANLWVDRGSGLEREDLSFGSEQDVRRLAVRMASAAGQRLDDAAPITDATIAGTVRLHAVIPPLAAEGTLISLRVIRRDPFVIDDLVRMGTMSEKIAAVLRRAVERRSSLLVSGPTGAGKTTLLASLLGLVSPNQRIVCIEEVSELSIDHPHVAKLQARSSNVEGEGQMGLPELVRAAVRMRPDRLVLGECRGPEVLEVLTAMNTGHRGCATTLHANSIADVPARLIALGALAGLDRNTVVAMADGAFELVIHMQRTASGRRYVSEIGTLRRRGKELRGCTYEPDKFAD